MLITSPLVAVQNLEQLYRHGFRDAVTDAALLKVASSQAARDTAVLSDIERDLTEFEQQYELSSHKFFQRWQAGQMADSADFMDWNALYQMAHEVRQRLEFLHVESPVMA
jgi:hypothetical protein